MNIQSCVRVVLLGGLLGYACPSYSDTVQHHYRKLVTLKEKYFPNPAYYQYTQSYCVDDINPYELSALMNLELREQVKKRLQQDALFLKADRLIILVISTLLSEVTSPEQAIYEWHSITQRLERTSDDFTDIQTQILNVSNEKIKDFYSIAQECKNELASTLKKTIESRMVSRHSYHDQHQCNQTATRSIDLLQANNITMSIQDKYLDTIKKAYIENPDRPILEQLKNYQIFDIGDFDNSKGAFIVHDIYDHFWFFFKLNDSAIFKNYPSLLLSLGNPHLTDIFSREGELIATIAAHFRWFHCAEVDYKPLLDMVDIVNILEYSKAVGTFSENQQRAYELLKDIEKDSLLFKAVPFVLSGMSIQMLKYITLNGFPRALNELYQPCGYFDVFEPEHVAFVIEATKFLFDDYDQSIRVLLNLTMLIEDYLVGVAQGNEQDFLTMNLQATEDIKNYDQFKRLTPKKISWMQNNIGFEVVRYPVGV